MTKEVFSRRQREDGDCSPSKAIDWKFLKLSWLIVLLKRSSILSRSFRKCFWHIMVPAYNPRIPETEAKDVLA